MKTAFLKLKFRLRIPWRMPLRCPFHKRKTKKLKKMIISRLIVVNSVEMSKIISKNVGYDPLGFKGPRIQGFE
jgi:hypothetical protein